MTAPQAQRIIVLEAERAELQRLLECAQKRIGELHDALKAKVLELPVEQMQQAERERDAYRSAFGPLVVGAEPVPCLSCTGLIAERDAAREELRKLKVHTPRLRGMTYGSDEYKQCLAEMGPGLSHHYENNRHHPEHHADGVAGMNLVDLVEMFVDWLASSRRHADGDIMKSIEINRVRFGMSDQLVSILKNTAEEWDPRAARP